MFELPPHSHLFDALRSLFGERVRIGTQLQNLSALLTALLADLPSDLDPALVRNLLQFIAPFIQGAGPENLASRIQQFMEQLGLGYEARLFAAVDDPKLLREFLGRSNSSLKGLLLRLRSQIILSSAQTTLPESIGNQLNRVMAALDGILTNIDAHEMVMSRELGSNENLFYLQVPYWQNNRPLTAEILGRSPDSDENRRLDPENMQLDLLIDTANMGTLKIHLQALQREMSCTILAEDAQYCDFIDLYKGDLLSRMKALNYNMKDVRLRVAEPDEFYLELIPTPPIPEGNLVQIDVTA